VPGWKAGTGGLKSFLRHGKYFFRGPSILFSPAARDDDQNDFPGSHFDLPQKNKTFIFLE
jgi:hypothetical protein